MAIVTASDSVEFPTVKNKVNGLSNTAQAMNTATDKIAMFGNIMWEDRGSHTISAAGGGSIKWCAGSISTFVNAGTSVDVGIQDVATGAGPLIQPDGTFDVKGTMVGGTYTITDAVFNTVTMTSGSKTLNQGDFFALVLDMTSRGGADAVRVSCSTPPNSTLSARPTTTQFKSGVWTNAGAGVPNIMLVADDGAKGIMACAVPILSSGTETFSDSTNPDERAFVFELPWDVEIDGYALLFSNLNNANADATICIYADPFGTPSVVSGSSINILGENFATTSPYDFNVLLPALVSLSKGTPYALAIRATGSNTVQVGTYTLPETDARKFIQGGTTLKKATRNNGSGAFTPESPAVTMYYIAVRIAGYSDSASSTVHPRSGLQGISEGMAR